LGVVDTFPSGVPVVPLTTPPVPPSTGGNPVLGVNAFPPEIPTAPPATPVSPGQGRSTPARGAPMRFPGKLLRLRGRRLHLPSLPLSIGSKEKCDTRSQNSQPNIAYFAHVFSFQNAVFTERDRCHLNKKKPLFPGCRRYSIPNPIVTLCRLSIPEAAASSMHQSTGVSLIPRMN
jgi:hypothetical protein